MVMRLLVFPEKGKVLGPVPGGDVMRAGADVIGHRGGDLWGVRCRIADRKSVV